MLNLFDKIRKLEAVPTIITALLVIYGIALLTDDSRLISIL